jgi:two-component system, NarL family, nitrate/nitrite response regulator NarL
MINILIADDHQMFIDGLRSLLERNPGIRITGEATNGRQVMECIEKEKPDLVLLDINMPEMNGIDTTALIRKKYPEIKVLILTMYKTKGFINGLTRTGAAGYILKNTGNAELMEAIRTVSSGGTFFSNEIAQTLSERPSRQGTPVNTTLSKREIEIIREMSVGLTTKEIAEKLSISFHTIETHRKNINSKLGLSNAAEVIRYAIDSGLLS